MDPARFGATDAESFALPIQIVEAQTDDFPGPQAIGHKQHEDCTIADVDRPLTLYGGQQTLNVIAFDTLRNGLVGHEPGRHDPCREPEVTPAPFLRKVEEPPQALREVVDCPPAPDTPPVLGFDQIVDVRHLYGVQRNAPLCKPGEEVVGRPAIVDDGRVRQAAFVSQPRLVHPQFGTVRRVVFVGLLEPAEEPHQVDAGADEPLTSFGRGRPVAPAAIRLGPYRRCCFDALKADSLAFPQIQKVDKVEMGVGAFAQRASASTYLLQVAKIACPRFG